MAISRDHLGGNRFGGQPHLLANMLFDGGVDIGESADSTGDRNRCDLRAGIFQPLKVTGELGIVTGQLDAKGRWFGVDRMAAANADCVLVLKSASFEGGEQRLNIGD